MTTENDALAKLSKKLVPWLEQQPEWPILFLSGRQARRRAARAVARLLETIPTVSGATEVMVAPAEKVGDIWLPPKTIEMNRTVRRQLGVKRVEEEE